MKTHHKTLEPAQNSALLATLKNRFEQNVQRHAGIPWVEIEAKLMTHPEKMWSLNQMEQTGGEPDVVGYDAETDAYIFYDCAPESPLGRRSFCYDHRALEARKQNKPQNSAMNAAEQMGITLLREEQYRRLQQLGEFDQKTSSWLATPTEIRHQSGALFGERRYCQVFIYHNGADSYYGVRGFRGCLRV